MKRVVITGAPKSGTSMVAGLLQECGLDLGPNLKPPNPWNPKGVCEDREFSKICRRLFKANGGHWLDPPARIDKWPPGLKDRARAFLARQSEELVGWKDPRACFCLQLWADLIGRESLKVVLVLRPWEQTAASLVRRAVPVKEGQAEGLNVGYDFDVDLDRGREIASLYVGNAIANLASLDWHAVFYPNFFTDWRPEARRLLDFIGLHVTLAARPEFIDETLWHQRQGSAA